MSLIRRLFGRFGGVSKRSQAFSAARNPTGRPLWNPPKGGPNPAVGSAGLTVAARARDAVRNNPYAARIVDLWVANAVRAGITTRWPKNNRVSQVWRTWTESLDCDATGQNNYAGIQALAVRAMVEGGEALIRFRQVRPTATNPVGLEMLCMEGDRLDWSKTGRTTDGNEIVQGIEVNDAGRPVAYWILPADDALSYRSITSERVPAQDIIHLFRQRRPGQMRDVSWLAPVLWTLRDLGQYEAALMRKAELEACVSMVVVDENDETASGAVVTDSSGNTVEDFQPGSILYRRGGGSIEVVNPTGGGSHTAYAKRALEAASSGAGLTYDQVSGDLSEANYSSLRAGKIEFWQLLDQVQYTILVPRLCDRVARRFYDAGLLAGLWAVGMPEVKHIPPAPEMVQPVDDTKALIMQERAGYVPPQEMVGRFGYEFSDVINDFAQANAARDAANLVFDTDPRKTASNGAAQAPDAPSDQSAA